jgi:hypothetical protein
MPGAFSVKNISKKFLYKKDKLIIMHKKSKACKKYAEKFMKANLENSDGLRELRHVRS